MSAVIFAAVAAAALGQDTSPKSSASLIAGPKLPSGAVRVGVLLRFDPGWHSYWINPGDSGVPIRVQWTLPRGWKAGPLRWPTPERINASGVISYGYSRQVVLLADLTPPAGKPSSGQISAKVEWLVCEDACLQATETVRLRLPSAANPLVAQTLAKLPKPQPAGLAARRSGRQISLQLPAQMHASRAEFFPSEAATLNHSAAQTLTNGALRLELSEFTSSPPRRLRGVLVLTTSSGRTSHSVDIPISN